MIVRYQVRYVIEVNEGKERAISSDFLIRSRTNNTVVAYTLRTQKQYDRYGGLVTCRLFGV